MEKTLIDAGSSRADGSMKCRAVERFSVLNLNGLPYVRSNARIGGG
jgi:hypothetical protein